MKVLTSLFCVSLASLLFLLSAAARPIDSATGGISLAGCRDCADNQSAKLHRCFQTTNPAGCSSGGCDETEYIFAKCNPTPANETDNCPMHVDATAAKGYGRKFQNTNGLMCTDNGPENFDPPADGPCQSPGFPQFQSRCKLAGTCGNTVFPGTQTVTYWGRLVCGA